MAQTVYESFALISQAESSRSVQQANVFASDITDIFTDESYYISLIELQNNITKWREKAEYENKLVKQDLLFYNILDLVDSSNKNGVHMVLGKYYEAEIERRTSDHSANKDMKDMCRDLLNLKGKNNQLESLKD